MFLHRYFTRFTQPDSLAYLLIGTTPREKFIQFDSSIKALMDEIMLEMGIEEPFSDSPEYKVVCDLLYDIRELSKQHISWGEYVSKQANSRGIDTLTDTFTQELSDERDRINKFAHEYIEESFAFIQQEPHSIIGQKAFHQFWAQKIHPLHIVHLDSLCTLITEYMTSLGADSVKVDHVVKGLRIRLTEEADICDGIDPFSLARVTRFLPPADDNFISVATILADVLIDGAIISIPGIDLNSNQVYYDEGQKEAITDLLSPSTTITNEVSVSDKVQSRRLGIYGPSLSGKTYRLLHIIHDQLSESMISMKSLKSNESFIETKNESNITESKIIDETIVQLSDKNISTAISSSDLITVEKPHLRDVIWIDLDRVDKESDGIARFSSQLFFRKCHVIEQLEKELTSLLMTIRSGAIFVIDNVSFVSLRAQMLSRISPVRQTSRASMDGSTSPILDMKTSSGKSNEDWIMFLSRVIRLITKFSDKVQLIVVGEDIDNLRTIVNFDKTFPIGALSSEAVKRMIKGYTSSLKVTSFLY
jgi:hypothetical protein